jgi:hypothetical protein
LAFQSGAGHFYSPQKDPIDDLIDSAGGPRLNVVSGLGYDPSGLPPADWLGQVDECHQQRGPTLVTGLLQDSHSSTMVASAASLWNGSQDSVLPFRQYHLSDNESQPGFANPNPYNFGLDILPATGSLQIETHCLVEQVSEDSTITACTGSNIQGMKRKRGPLDNEKRQKAKEVRRKGGACLRCKTLKEPVRM